MRTSVVAAGLAVAVWAGAWAPAARGALYLKLAGVTGDVTAEGYLDDIEAWSFGLTATRPVDIGTGAGTGKDQPGLPQFSDVSVTASGSAASVAILQRMLSGQPFETLNLYVTKPSMREGRQVTVAEWDFENAYVTSFGTSSDGSGPPAEAYKFAFESFTYKWFNFDDKGLPSGHVEVGYDLLTGKSASLMEGDVTGFAFVTGVPEPGCAMIAAAGVLGALGGRRPRRGK